MVEAEKEINFLDSFKADTYIVRQIIDSLIRDLKDLEYPRDDRDEIILAMDEAVTNAVQETLFTRETSIRSNPHSHEITVRYRITEDTFDATVIDHGKGLDIDKMLSRIPDNQANDYKQQLFNYAKKADGNKLRIRVNGRDIAINGIGAGLKIMLSFMDRINIDLIDNKSVISSNVGDTTEGSILNMRRKRRYQQ